MLRVILFFFFITIALKSSIANYVSIYKTGNEAINFYKYSAILPVVTDSNNIKWVYFTLDIHNKKTVIDLFGGIIEKKDNSIFNAGIREFNEESLDIFKSNILNKKDFKIIESIDYKAFSTKLFIVSIKDSMNNIKNNCDYFTRQFYLRRYKKPNHYQTLSLAQKEAIGIRKVKLNDLIEYIKNPNKYPNGLTTFYSDLKSCNLESKEKFRFESEILLSFASIRNALLKLESKNN